MSFEAVESYATGMSSEEDWPLFESNLRAHPEYVERPCFNGDSLIQWATISNRPKAVQLLLELGADPLAESPSNSGTPLSWAFGGPCREAAEPIVQALDARKIVVPRDTWSELLFGPVRWNSDNETAARLTKLLLDKGADPNFRDEEGNTPLFTAVSIPAAQLLLQYGADVNARNNAGESVIFHHMKNGPTTSAQFLLTQVESINERDEIGRTMLHHAVIDGDNGWVPAARALVKLGADLEARDNQGRTPLYQAAGSLFFGGVQALLKYGADVNARDNEGRTPLWAAAVSQYLGTNPYYAPPVEDENDPQYNNSGDPVQYAKDRQRMATLLRKAGATLE